MKDVPISERVLPVWYRRLSTVVVLMTMAVLSLHFWGLARGVGHWEDTFPFLALLLLNLVPTFQIKGLLGHALQIVGLVVLAVAMVVLIRAPGH